MDADRTGIKYGVCSSSALPQYPTIESLNGEYKDENSEVINILQTGAASGGENAR